MASHRVNRRRFLQTTGLASLAGAGFASRGSFLRADEPGPSKGKVALVFHPDDAVATSKPAQWAATELRDALTARGVAARLGSNVDEVGSGERCVLFRSGHYSWREVAQPDGRQLALSPMALPDQRPATLAWGADASGLMYALLELTDRVTYSDEPLAAIEIRQLVVEKPANAVRSIARSFASDVEDKPWFNDRDGWRQYLSMLARQRFNRFSLHFGLGYDFTREIKDSYFHFAYPFLVSPPDYKVRAIGLSEREREQNLAMLRFASDEAAVRGIAFNLGIWTHAFEWTDSPNVNYTIEGLTADNHAAYCRDALATVLTACPSIGGITIRSHGESGVAEGNNDFWETVFEGFGRVGRRIEIDMHPKGLDQSMLDVALATGMPVQVSPKFWAEHMGLPYHQASIRPTELPQKQKDKGFFAKSGGSRRFLRYGYGDLLTEDRRYTVVHRIWPGTQRLLLWGDPEMAAAYSRQGSFCGTQGIEVMEPLTFRGKKGTGVVGDRAGYADTQFAPQHDWQKYEYSYCLWGRLLYNPEAEPETWRRVLRKSWGHETEAAEAALASASRILPLVTTAHLPSAANNNFWPEMYQNMSLVDETAPAPYKDTPTPKRFGTVSPLDPTLFYSVSEFANDVLKEQCNGRYTPLEVAARLEQLSKESAAQLAAAQKQATNDSAARRLAIDTAIQSDLGQFFAHKLRASAHYEIFLQAHGRDQLSAAIREYRAARDVWARLAKRATGVYVSDVAFGHEPQQRGHWSDRLPAIDADIATLQSLYDKAPEQSAAKEVAQPAPLAAKRLDVTCRHEPPPSFRSGEPLTLTLSVAKAQEPLALAARLHYRHVNQADAHRVAEMKSDQNAWQAVIPADYTQSPFPLEYFFELQSAAGQGTLYPGFAPSLCNQPYFVVRRRA
jgi:hypothetical protein